MTAMGRAAVATSADQPIELREYPVPAPSADEILVRTTVAGLCGSDLHIWRGEVPPLQPYPSVPGHEGTGRVVALGKAAAARHARPSAGRRRPRGVLLLCPVW